MAGHQGQIFDLFAFLGVSNEDAPVSSWADFFINLCSPGLHQFPSE
jgi:hypothetical protein